MPNEVTTNSFSWLFVLLILNEFNKRSYKYKHKNGGTYEVLSSNFAHVKNGTHNLTPEQWDDILTNLDDINSIEEARISDAKGLHDGTIVFQKVKGTLGTYGVITEYSTSGRVFVTTAGMDGGPNVNVNNWAKKVRGSQILQQKALKLTAGKVGQSSYTKILQERLGIVKRFYKQLEKGAILPQADGSYIISLFKHADASTVIHETGHYFVETLVEEALANPDNKQLNNDARILLEYAGTNLEAWRNWDVDSKRPAHEILANAFETLVYIFCIYKNIVIMVIG